MEYVDKDVLIWKDVELLTKEEETELLWKLSKRVWKEDYYEMMRSSWVADELKSPVKKTLHEYCRKSWENTFRTDSPCKNAPWSHKRIHVSGYWEDGGINSGMIVDYSVYSFLAAVYTIVGDTHNVKIYEDKFGDFHIETKQKNGTYTHHYTLRTEEDNEPLHFFHYVYGWDGHWVPDSWLHIPDSSYFLHEDELTAIKIMADEYKISEE